MADEIDKEDEDDPEFRKFADKPVKDTELWLAGLLSRGDAGTIERHWGKVRERIRSLITDLNGEFVNREDAIEVSVASLVSGIPALLLGPPGTAKSAIASRIAALCGLSAGEPPRGESAGQGSTPNPPDSAGGYFEYLLTSHTMPEELFGILDLDALSKREYKRVTKGKLPEAEIVFIDEVFRGGSHILNTLLTIINERRYDSGAGSQPVSLLSLLGASNHPPVEEDLAAFFDRFPIRVWLNPVLGGTAPGAGEPDPACEVLIKSVESEKRRLEDVWDQDRARAARIKKRRLCTNDLRVAQAYLRARFEPVEGSGRVREFLAQARESLAVTPLSDRSLWKLWLFAAALDLVRGQASKGDWAGGGRGHIQVFRYVGSNETQQQDLGVLIDRKYPILGPQGAD